MVNKTKEKQYEELTFTDDMSDKLKNFFDYLCKREAKGEFVKKIEREVDRVRKHEEWRLEYMTLFMRDMEKKEEGRQEGILEGKFICYFNALSMNMARRLAMQIAEITEEEALWAEQLREAGEI